MTCNNEQQRQPDPRKRSGSASEQCQTDQRRPPVYYRASRPAQGGGKRRWTDGGSWQTIMRRALLLGRWRQTAALRPSLETRLAAMNADRRNGAVAPIVLFQPMEASSVAGSRPAHKTGRRPAPSSGCLERQLHGDGREVIRMVGIRSRYPLTANSASCRTSGRRWRGILSGLPAPPQNHGPATQQSPPWESIVGGGVARETRHGLLLPVQ